MPKLSLLVFVFLGSGCAQLADIDVTTPLQIEGCCALATRDEIEDCARDVVDPVLCETHVRVELSCELRGLYFEDICD